MCKNKEKQILSLTRFELENFVVKIYTLFTFVIVTVTIVLKNFFRYKNLQYNKNYNILKGYTTLTGLKLLTQNMYSGLK